MAEATLDAPLTLDPLQAAKLVIRNVVIDMSGRTLTVHFDMLGVDGSLLARRTITASGAQVQAWISNNESVLYQRLLSKLGVTGIVA